jgi:adenylate cyclase class IV
LLDELEEMEIQINDTLNNNDVTFKLDFDYWEKIMKKLKVYKAKVFLKFF